MKKLLLALLLPVLSIAQEEKINFTHKLMYEMNLEEDTINLNLYYSTEGNVMEIGDRKILLKNQLFVPVDINLERTINVTNKMYIDSIPSFTLLKTDKKDKINGISCTYYDMQLKEKSNEKMKMCISENNPIDILGSLPITNKNIKGLIVKIGSEKREGEWFVLKSVNKTNSSISIDWQETLAKIQEKLKEQETFPVDSAVVEPYEYDEDSIAVDSVSIPFTYNITTYNSEYKTSKTKDTNLAIEELEKDSPYWQGLPQYCANIENKIPRFSDKKLKEHVKNYAGQICDLYLSEIKEYSVDVKGTLDQVRYEENYFRNYKSNEKDRKLLTDFLNELD